MKGRCRNNDLYKTKGASFTKKGLHTLELLIVKCLANHEENKTLKKFFSPKEAAMLFQPPITIQTLDNWVRKGILQKHYLGTKPFFLYSELLAALKTLNRYESKSSIKQK